MSELKFIKLNSNNYEPWSITLTSLLKSKGLWKFIERQVDTTAIEEDDVEYEQMEEAKMYIYASMEEKQIREAGKCSTPKELWDRVRVNSEGAEKSQKSQALAEFLGLKHRKNETIIEYSSRFESLRNKLEEADHRIDRDTQLWVYRNSLPVEIKTLVDHWNLSKPNEPIRELITYLKIRYHSDKLEKQEEGKNIAYFGSQFKQNSANESERKHKPDSYSRNKTFEKSPYDQAKSSSSTKLTCTYCKREGHIWKDCRKLQADNKRKRQFGQQKKADKTSESKPRAFITKCSRNGSIYDEHSWVIDSGATSHMSPHKHLLTDYADYESPQEITMGTGMKTQAFGEGHIVFTSGPYAGKLSRVIWVPELQENLFSLAETTKLGYDVLFKFKQGLVQFISNDEVVLQGRLTGRNLFELNLRTNTNRVSHTEPETVYIANANDLHQRFAHAGPRQINELIKNEAVNGLDATEKIQIASFQCDDCAVSKMCRSSHQTRRNIEADENSAVLHIDTVGPINVTSLGGSNYFVLATDEYSGYMLVECIADKTEVGNCVKRMISEFELISKTKVKKILTDNGKEYVNGPLDDWLEERGVLHEVSSNYTPEQNGRAERSNRTIIEGVRTVLSDSGLDPDLWAEATKYVVYSMNRTLSTRDRHVTKYELVYKRKPDVTNLRKFGQRVVILKRPTKMTKFGTRGENNHVFVGYTNRYNTYRILNLDDNSISITSDVKFMNGTARTCCKCNQHKPTNDVNICVSNLSERDVARGTRVLLRDLPDNDGIRDNEHQCMMDSPSTASENEQPIDDDEQGSNREANHDDYMPSDESGASLHSSSSRPNSIATIMDEESNDSIYHDASNDSLPRRAEESSSRPLTRSVKRVTNQQFTMDPKLPSYFWDSSQNWLNQNSNQRALFTLNNEPRTFEDAMASTDREKWKKAMNEEMDSLLKNETWVLVNSTKKPNGEFAKPIKCKWVYKIKPGDVYKARLVAKGYSQIENVDYKQTFAPVASMNLIRIMLALACQLDMEILQFDVKTAFLYGDLEETIFMEYPQGYSNDTKKYCRLQKSLYGLKQSPRQWNKKFDEFVKLFNLRQSSIDKCFYYNEKRTLFLIIYVDDGLISSTDKPLMKQLIAHLKKHFELKVTHCDSYLGLKIKRDSADKSITIDQSTYIQSILERFNMCDCNPISTPEEVGNLKELTNSEPLNPEAPFKELIGSLLYLVTCSRPDIAHALSIASRTSKPTVAHWKFLKRILRYLKGTQNIGIRFRREKFPELVGFSDADYANDAETRRSTTGFCIMYGSAPIAWRCQRQPIVALSTTEAEYISGSELVKEILPIRELLIEIHQLKDEPVKIKIDNLSTVKIANDERGQQRTKHIDVRQKWLTEQAANNKIRVEHISAEKQVADMLTKPLHKSKFVANRNMLLTTITIMCLVNCVISETVNLPKVNPLFFKPTQSTYLSGDTEFNLTVIIMNPCERLFKGWTGGSWGTEAYLIDGCNESYSKKILKQMNHCKSNITEIAPFKFENLKNEGVKTERKSRWRVMKRAISDDELYEQTFGKVEHNDKKGLMREKRVVPMIFIGGILLIAGGQLLTAIQTSRNSANIDRIKDDRDKQIELLTQGGALLTEMRESIHGLNNWSAGVDSKLEKAKNDMSKEYLARTAALVNHYETTFSDQEKILKQLNIGFGNRKISPALLELSNETLWDEPVSKWSTLYDCRAETRNDTLFLDLSFNMPIKDNAIKIVEAVAIPFYNKTINSDGKESLCWTTYNGPKHILFNTTNGCMTDTISWAEKDEAIRSQTCKDNDEQMKDLGNPWQPEICTDKVSPLKRRISDYELNGMHRIYCFPFNITIDEKEYSCPDFVFEIEAKRSFKVANFEHTGRYVERTVMRDTDFHRSKTILQRMKVDEIKLGALNLTGLDSAYSSYMSKLTSLPKKLELLPNIISGGFFGTIGQMFSDIWKWIQTAGFILAFLAAGLLLLIAAPFIELIIIFFALFKYPLKLWKRNSDRVFNNIKKKTTRRYRWEKTNDYTKLV